MLGTTYFIPQIIQHTMKMAENQSINSDFIGMPRWLQENGKKVRTSRRRSFIHIEENN